MNSYKEYMYYLLISPLKKVKKATNQFYILFQVLGSYFDNSMEMLFKAREQSMIEKADPTFLSEHGKDRKMFKYQGELAENYRKRLMMKAEIAEQAGSNESIELTLISLGIDKPIVIPTYLKDSKRWAEFDVLIDEVYMEVISLYIIMQEVRKIKQASSLPNYGFLLHSDSGSLCGAEIKLTNRIFISELDIRSIYLDGSWNLDGTSLLGGSSNSIRNYRHTLTNRIEIETKNTTQINMITEKHLWKLDGYYNLDGQRVLDAEIIQEEI